MGGEAVVGGSSGRSRTWTGALVVLGTGLFLLDVLPLRPGFLSFDSVVQLGQALHPSTLTDWHPPVMTVLWSLLLELSGGDVGSMLVAQLGLLWASLTLLAVYVRRHSGRRWLSLLPLLLGVLPHVTAVSAVIWKDAQLAFALLAAVVLLLFVRRGTDRVWLRRAAVVAVVLLLAYAGAVRHNALPAVVPLLFLLSWPGAARQTRVLLAGTALVGALTANLLVGAVRPVQETHPGASVQLDDVLHLYSSGELRSADVDPQLRGYLVTMATTCPPSTRDVNYTWRCANRTGRVPPVLRVHADELRGLYLDGIAERPLRYAGFRLRVFGEFLVPPPEEGRLVSWTTIIENRHGLVFEPNPVSRALESSVVATARHAGFVFEPWTWLLAALGVAGLALRRRAARHAGVVLAVGLSSAGYVLAYLPVVTGYDYRFVYWPAVGVSVAVVLLLLDGRTAAARGHTLPPATAPALFPREHHLTGTTLEAPPFEDVWRPGWPLDVRRTLFPHQRSAGDPALRHDADGCWRAVSTPDGPATVHLTVRGGEVRVTAWGPGAERAGATVPAWLGAEDRPEEFDPGGHPLLTRVHRASPWLRLGRTGRTWDALVPAVLEQKVTVIEAHRVWRALLRLAGEPAPGPAPEGMRVPPTPQRVLAVTDWEWHRCGLDGARRRALRAVAGVAARLEPEEAVDCPDLQRRLRTVPGIGVWTAAEVVQRVFGCPDTVSYGDYHLKNLVGWSLAGRKTDDDGMMELLEPWRGQRQRVVRLLGIGGSRPPKRGPRNAPSDYRRI